MKKILSVILCALICLCAFTACSSGTGNKDAEKNTSAVSDSEQEKIDEALSNAGSQTDSAVQDSKTDFKEAAITEFEAVDKIKAMSVERLGLSGKLDDYKIMVATVGKTIDGKDYFEVVASKVTEEKDDGSVNMETAGTYYVSYDGETVLYRNSETGDFTDITK